MSGRVPNLFVARRPLKLTKHCLIYEVQNTALCQDGSIALLCLTDTYSPAKLGQTVSGDTTSKNDCFVAEGR